MTRAAISAAFPTYPRRVARPGPWFAPCCGYTHQRMMLDVMASLRQLLSRDTRGAVSTEYVVLMSTMGLVVVFSLVAVGPTLVKNFTTTRTVIASPFP